MRLSSETMETKASGESPTKLVVNGTSVTKNKSIMFRSKEGAGDEADLI